MAGAKEIRTKIQSIQNTQKITRAMEMVAASKMRKAKDRMSQAHPYADRIREVLRHVGAANLGESIPYLLQRDPVKRVGIIVVSTDRGLCGGLNANMFRTLIKQFDEWESNEIEFDCVAIGSRGAQFLRRFGANVLAQTSHLGDAPAVEQLFGSIRVILEEYVSGEIDALYFAYNEFVNSMTQTPVIEKILPRELEEVENKSNHWDYIYEPDAIEVLTLLVERYIESLVYQGVVENIACEQSARMVAMKAASDNAGNLISEFQLAYNKARQAAITQELSEIVGGAAAV